jgi:type II restriction/modification system DNA methylase subunit YeeA
MTKNKKTTQNTYTYDEYNRKFFPSKIKNLQIAKDSPDEFGAKLANETLNEMRQILAKKQHKHKKGDSFQVT